MSDEDYVRVYQLQTGRGDIKTILTTIDNVYVNNDKMALVQWKSDKGTNTIIEGKVDANLHSEGMRVLEARIIPSDGCIALPPKYVPPHSTVFGVNVISRMEYDSIVERLEDDKNEFSRERTAVQERMDVELRGVRVRYRSQFDAIPKPDSIEERVAKYVL